jgi:NADPH:quinone reductase-like Zn-dependent oxidoreductase
MNQMRAAQYDSYGPPEVLRIRTVPVPSVQAGHVLVRVAASSINGADTAVRAGKLKLVSGRSFPRGAGFDFAGTVTEVAGDVTGLAAGDEVWGFVNAVRSPGPSAAAAEYVLAPAGGTALRPRTVSAVEAAAVSAVGASALGILRDRLRLQRGERVLVRGANGGSAPSPSSSPAPSAARSPRWPAHRTWTGCGTWAPSRPATTTSPAPATSAGSTSSSTRCRRTWRPTASC